MKSLVGLLLVVASATSLASGLKRTIYDCSAGTGEDAVSLRVVLLETAPPGGPVSRSYHASAAQSWLGGTHSSGDVVVRRTVENGVEKYRNAGAKFELEVFKSRGTKPREILAEAEFVDPRTKREGRIYKRWLTCK